MRKRSSLVAIASVAATASCLQSPSNLQAQPTTSSTTGGQIETTSGPSKAKELFVGTLYPSLAETCGFCHIGGANGAPQWLGGGANTAYDRIDA